MEEERKRRGEEERKQRRLIIMVYYMAGSCHSSRDGMTNKDPRFAMWLASLLGA
jgi:hypothetical protein